MIELLEKYDRFVVYCNSCGRQLMTVGPVRTFDSRDEALARIDDAQWLRWHGHHYCPDCKIPLLSMLEGGQAPTSTPPEPAADAWQTGPLPEGEDEDWLILRYGTLASKNYRTGVYIDGGWSWIRNGLAARICFDDYTHWQRVEGPGG